MFLKIKNCAFSGKRFTHVTPEKRNDIFEMIDNAVSICSDDDWLKVSLDLQYYLFISFFKIICTILLFFQILV